MKESIQTHRNVIATEDWDLSYPGPTGRLRIVERAELQDYGGNVYVSATTPLGLKRVKHPCGVAVKWVPAKEGGLLPESEFTDCVI